MEEFSFPVIASNQDLPFPHFASSPLWLLSPSQDKNPENMAMNVKSRTNQGVEIKKLDEDKMDMLWEDFNEEGINAAKCNLDKKLGFSNEFDATKDGRIVSRKRIRMVVILKVLKRYFNEKIGHHKSKEKVRRFF